MSIWAAIGLAVGSGGIGFGIGYLWRSVEVQAPMTDGAARLRLEEAIALSVWDAIMQIDGWAAFWVAEQKPGGTVMRHPAVTKALNDYAAAEKQRGRVEALREIRDEAQRQSAEKKQGLWLALYESAIAKLNEAERALRGLEDA